MSTSRRLALLMLTALSVMGPSNRVPGSDPMRLVPARTVPCPKPNCGKGRRQEDNIYKCGTCGDFFNYCRLDKSYFPNSEAAHHQHASG